MGKSRLVAEAAAIAVRQGFTVLSGQCAEIGGSVPYLPFADALRTAPPRVEEADQGAPGASWVLPDTGWQTGERAAR